MTGPVLLRRVIPGPVAAALNGFASEHRWVAAGVNGYRLPPGSTQEVGSWRATFHSPVFAASVWQRMRPKVNVLEVGSVAEDENDDAPFGAVWEAVGLNPMMRMIRYRADGGDASPGLLLPHYDAPYRFDDCHITRASVVFYLELAQDGGRTRFIREHRSEHGFSDWDRQARSDEVELVPAVDVGDALVFPHRVLHDGEPVRDGRKTIIRTDIIYRRRA